MDPRDKHSNQTQSGRYTHCVQERSQATQQTGQEERSCHPRPSLLLPRSPSSQAQKVNRKWKELAV